MNKLISLAKKFETKLGIVNATRSLPKQLQKIANVEHKLQKKIVQQQNIVSRISEDVSVKTRDGRVPGIYLICNDCSGKGKTISFSSDLTVKLASTGDVLPVTRIARCTTCNGRRVIKVADVRLCSEAQMAGRAHFVKDKEVGKNSKKIEKKKKKAAKAIAKAEQKRMEAENPMAYKAAKFKKKADKKAKKAAEKAMKAVEEVKRVEENDKK